MLNTKGVMQIGWSTRNCQYSQEKGVGDTNDSYAYDGSRVSLPTILILLIKSNIICYQLDSFPLISHTIFRHQSSLDLFNIYVDLTWLVWWIVTISKNIHPSNLQFCVKTPNRLFRDLSANDIIIWSCFKKSNWEKSEEHYS